MVVYITGGRDFRGRLLREQLHERCDYYFQGRNDLCFIHTFRWGVEHEGRMYGELRDHKVEGYNDTPLRLLPLVDVLIVFWDGKDRETYNLIKSAKQLDLTIRMDFYYQRPRLRKKFATKTDHRRHRDLCDRQKLRNRKSFDTLKKEIYAHLNGR